MMRKKIFGLAIVCTLLFAACGNIADNQDLSKAISSKSAETIRQEVESVEIKSENVPTYASDTKSKTASSSTKKQSSSKKTTAKSKTNSSGKKTDKSASSGSKSSTVALSSVAAYSDTAYTTINDNEPGFSASDKTRTDAFETYSKLDSSGRCGVAYANVCQELMPTEERGAIGSVKPSGWHTVKYAGVVDGNYLYNRCHLIGYQLSGENANKKNLITGTRYLNVEGMLPFENMVADYVEETDNHVLYRVTPIFDGDNLVASGVQMEAYSVEDKGAGICFNVYCYNVQPGISIDYATGDSALSGEEISKSADKSSEKAKKSTKSSNTSKQESSATSSVAETAPVETAPAETAPAPAAENTQSEATAPAESSTEADTRTASTETVHITETGSKYHRAGCRYLKSDIEVTLEEALARGLTPCGVCNP